MIILKGILIFVLLIWFFAEIYLFNKLKDLNPDKEGGKLSIIATANDDFFAMDQQISNIRAKSDCIQADGKFLEYPSGYILECEYRFGCIKEISLVITAYRNMYPKEDYGLILQTNKPLGIKTTSDKNITYRIIVLKKYNKENKLMDEKQKILNDIEEAQRKLDEARKKLDEYNTGYKRWKPKEGEEFWYIDSSGSVNYTRFMSEIEADTEKFENYNCFKTKGEALQEAEKILVRRQLEDIVKRLNKGEKIDWRNLEQNKYYLSCDNYNRYGKICCGCSNNKVQCAVYCLDINFLDVAIREICEDRLIKYIGGEG